ncbi:unnamed protein product [Blepharisma stoltei]|uniref:Uncharacterized protein n=1 Tax=Blepharisma stoltei TaxID=1481888 RepID=A0AAU9IMJ1_9CILI|nr:unnamed protein product [Blepharisma stoltei]
MLLKPQSRIDTESNDSGQALSIMTIGRRESREDVFASIDNYQSLTNGNTTESMITLIGHLKPRNESMTINPTENTSCCLFPIGRRKNDNSNQNICNIF